MGSSSSSVYPVTPSRSGSGGGLGRRVVDDATSAMGGAYASPGPVINSGPGQVVHHRSPHGCSQKQGLPLQAAADHDEHADDGGTDARHDMWGLAGAGRRCLSPLSEKLHRAECGVSSSGSTPPRIAAEWGITTVSSPGTAAGPPVMSAASDAGRRRRARHFSDQTDDDGSLDGGGGGSRSSRRSSGSAPSPPAVVDSDSNKAITGEDLSWVLNKMQHRRRESSGGDLDYENPVLVPSFSQSDLRDLAGLQVDNPLAMLNAGAS